MICLGCGQHVAQVLRDVPLEERCQCAKEAELIVVENPVDDFLIY